ncbi:hypothetical protein FAUST_291 [Fusarium austroamericanum]|uniref:Hydrolase n=1 Tax=Fusarium austroamericanum TaxID=282268 RepID=A0AAN6CAR9_FUSAU|nr:hypothetical protein FAUST_291 [Fusarium austroamericanum]
MSQTTRPKVIFFDLDGTLFDDYHSLQCAIAEARHTVRIPDTMCNEELAATYLKARDTTYSVLRNAELREEELRLNRIYKFFSLIGLKDYIDDELQAFDATYKEVYRSSNRATTGTIETLTKLKEMGYKIGIITNASAVSQQDKIDRIGIAHLIDGLFAYHELFNVTPEMLEGEGKTYMVGDDLRCDVRGAWDAGLDPIVNAPPCAEPVPGPPWASLPDIYEDMTQLLGIIADEEALERARDGDKDEEEDKDKNEDKGWGWGFRCSIL